MNEIQYKIKKDHLVEKIRLYKERLEHKKRKRNSEKSVKKASKENEFKAKGKNQNNKRK